MNVGPGFRLRTVHLTTFTYRSPARASYNEVRMVPQTTPAQMVLDARVHTTPHAPQYTYWDYWGSQVVSFDIEAPHDVLVVEGSSLVETQSPAPVPGATWQHLTATADTHAELLTPTAATRPNDELTEVARRLADGDPASTARHILEWTNQTLDYLPGATHVHTSATEAFAARAGVCQDFAHLALAVLRSAHIPARYVSGYLHPDADAAVGSEVTGESHAWVECWLGDWWGFDPTNALEIGRRHVLVARGRDYADVAPVKGVYAGSADHAAEATVTITRSA